MEIKDLQNVKEVKQVLEFLSQPEKRDFYPKFFRTAPGQYGFGDVFIGVVVPDQRKIAKEYFKQLSLDQVAYLLSSKIHEHRHTALLMLVLKYEKSIDQKAKNQIVDMYLSLTRWINSWDLVDNSVYKILGRHAFEQKQPQILKRLALSDSLWEKRMAVVGTMYHIKKGEFDLTKEIVLLNLQHPHDLMHKANGWLLREVGKKNEEVLKVFLKENYSMLPRTTLRYAIEKLSDSERAYFLKGNF